MRRDNIVGICSHKNVRDYIANRCCKNEAHPMPLSLPIVPRSPCMIHAPLEYTELQPVDTQGGSVEIQIPLLIPGNRGLQDSCENTNWRQKED